MGEKIISVVVPAYNVEQYLMTCLGSILLPEFLEDIEVIVVDDGSTDNTRQLALAYEKEYPDTVRVITKPNGGHGSALNYGIQASTGRYVRCVDADDWVDGLSFALLIQKLSQTHADVVATRFQWVDDATGQVTTEHDFDAYAYVECGKVYTFDEISKYPYIKMHQMNYRTKLLQECERKLDEHCFYVDVEYVLFPIPQVKTVEFLDLNVYQYRVGTRQQSMNILNMQKNVKDHDHVLHHLLEFYDDCRKASCSEAVLEYLENGIARMVVSQAKIWLSFPIAREHRRQLRALQKEITSKYPAIRKRIQNNAVKMLFASNCLIYLPVSVAVRLKTKAR